VEDDEARTRIKDIAAHCQTLLGDEDDDLFGDAEDEDDPEMEKALFVMRKLVAQMSALSA
jgi:hypothetical protein